MDICREPRIKVGIVDGPPLLELSLTGQFFTAEGTRLSDGHYKASLNEDGRVRLDGPVLLESPVLTIYPENFETCHLTLHEVTIGIDFHWERREELTYQGNFRISPSSPGLAAINELPLESYIVSVISSEMSASSPPELLRAHAIMSRSWLLAQLAGKSEADETSSKITCVPAEEPSGEIVRWYGHECHRYYDVCGDDHCQRYQGITRAFSREVFDAVEHTRGNVLVHGGEICDARYSKSCGGMTEAFSSAWEDKEVPYLKPIYDGAGMPTGFFKPLSNPAYATRWITASPPAYCNSASAVLLERVLPGFDQETQDFYRWEVSYSASYLSELLSAKLGVDFGTIITLEPIERGESGRIIKLKITGEKRSRIIGKELEIRKALSPSHLYSSAFVIRAALDPLTNKPKRFHLVGAGWGHGVGLCQIGAAVMADLGYSHREILAHYFRGAELKRLY